MNHREVTASELYKKQRRLTVGYHSKDKPGVDVPYMRLCGRWLQDAGFVIGRHVRLRSVRGG